MLSQRAWLPKPATVLPPLNWPALEAPEDSDPQEKVTEPAGGRSAPRATQHQSAGAAGSRAGAEAGSGGTMRIWQTEAGAHREDNPFVRE